MSNHSKFGNWGVDNGYASLHDVLQGTPEFYKWVEAGNGVIEWFCKFTAKVLQYNKTKIGVFRWPQIKC